MKLLIEWPECSALDFFSGLETDAMEYNYTIPDWVLPLFRKHLDRTCDAQNQGNYGKISQCRDIEVKGSEWKAAY
jgi:hypothetical protein